jgi:hypothetical protein
MAILLELNSPASNYGAGACFLSLRLGFAEGYEHLLLLSFYGVCQGKNRVPVQAKDECTPFKTSLETK